MRIALAVERYFPAIGGAERVVERVAEGLVERGHEVLVLTSGERSSDRRHGVTVERFPVSGNAVTGIRGPVGAAVDRLMGFRPHVILCYAAQTWTTDVLLPLLDALHRPAMVLAPCGFSALHNPDYSDYFETLKERLRRYDATIFHSERYQDFEFAVAAGIQRPAVIPNGADEPAPRPTAAAGCGPLVVTVGSHVRSKGHREAISTMASLARSHGAVGWVVGPRRRGLDRLRGCQPCCDLRTTGRSALRQVDGSDPSTALTAISAADLLLSASRIECSPLVIIEAMAAGTPWVSYDAGNVRELDGGLVVDRDPKRLLTAARRVLDGREPDLAERGRARWRARHRWPAIVTQYEKVLREASAGRRDTPAR